MLFLKPYWKSGSLILWEIFENSMPSYLIHIYSIALMLLVDFYIDITILHLRRLNILKHMGHWGIHLVFVTYGTCLIWSVGSDRRWFLPEERLWT